MTSEDSVGKFHRTFTVSYSAKKKRLLNQNSDPNITETVVGLDDDYPAPYADSAQEASDAGETGHLEIHTS